MHGQHSFATRPGRIPQLICAFVMTACICLVYAFAPFAKASSETAAASFSAAVGSERLNLAFGELNDP